MVVKLQTLPVLLVELQQVYFLTTSTHQTPDWRTFTVNLRPDNL